MSNSLKGVIAPEKKLSAFEVADRKRYEKLAASTPNTGSETKFSYPDIPGTEDLLVSLG